MSLYIGLMSGTSMDGIDAALVDVDSNKLIMGLTHPYSSEAKRFLQAVLNDEYRGPAAFSQLNTLIGREFASAALVLLKKANIASQQVVAIGSHGQTICHDATADIPYTVQLGCAHTIAELTGLTVVADFRTRDLVLGGQGAPYAPIYHHALFGGGDLPLAIVNIGGIANVTFLTDDGEISGYDVGPGNCLMDAWIKQHLGLAYDAGGEWAQTGEVIVPLLNALVADPYFLLPPPKSLGKEYFSQQWLEDYLQADYVPENVQATLLALTANTIADVVNNSPYHLKRVAICGGGVHNVALLTEVSTCLPNLWVGSTSLLGIDPDYMEAMMLAWLASKTLRQTPLDLTRITGSRKEAIYGVIYAAGIDKRNSIDV